MASAASSPLVAGELAVLDARGDWIVCHTKARAEKKFAALLAAEKLSYYLPLVPSVRTYERRTKTFFKPLFSGYVFAQVPPPVRSRLYQQDLLARVIAVDDEARFLAQLRGVQAVLAAGLHITLQPLLTRGRAVRIMGGPLQGVEGIVENITSPEEIIIAIDILQQGIPVRVPLAWIEPLP